MSTVIPEGFRLGDGWRTHRGHCACTRRSAIGVICLDHAPYVTENGEAACAAHAVEMGALVRVEEADVPTARAAEMDLQVRLWDAVNEYTEACGGGAVISVRRMNAVVAVNTVVRAALATADARAAAAEDKLARIGRALENRGCACSTIADILREGTTNEGGT